MRRKVLALLYRNDELHGYFFSMHAESRMKILLSVE